MEASGERPQPEQLVMPSENSTENDPDEALVCKRQCDPCPLEAPRMKVIWWVVGIIASALVALLTGMGTSMSGRVSAAEQAVVIVRERVSGLEQSATDVRTRLGRIENKLDTVADRISELKKVE